MKPKTHIQVHDPEHVKYSKKRAKECGIIKPREEIWDIQGKRHEGDLQTKDKILKEFAENLLWMAMNVTPLNYGGIEIWLQTHS